MAFVFAFVLLLTLVFCAFAIQMEDWLDLSAYYLPLWFSWGYWSRSTSVPGRGCMGGGGRGMLAQHVPFDLEVFVPPLIFFFFATLAPRGRQGEIFQIIWSTIGATPQYYSLSNLYTYKLAWKSDLQYKSAARIFIQHLPFCRNLFCSFSLCWQHIKTVSNVDIS